MQPSIINPPGRVESILKNQAVFPRINGWCFVELEGRTFCASILDIKDNQAEIRVVNSRIPVTEWKVQSHPLDKLSPTIFLKHDNLEDLLASLKSTNTLTTPKIENALRTIDRSLFCRETPYANSSVEIGYDMCISAPNMHVQALECSKELFDNAKAILDVGSGSGYLTALYAELAPAAHVYGIEYYAGLLEESQRKIDGLPESLKSRITLRHGDGLKGLKESGPFDIIHVGFMCKEEPTDLIDQLAPGGLLLVPIGNRVSTLNPKFLAGELYAFQKQADGTINKYSLFTCSFVPSQQ